MSMLSAQCAELRDKAKLMRGHADGLKAPYVIPSTKELMALTMLDSAMRMEEAADTIISLRDRLQAAELGSGTCHSTTDCSAWCFACSECGKSFPRNDLHLAHNHGEINYCPNCGRKVAR